MRNLFIILLSIGMLTNVSAQKDTVDVASGVGTLEAAIASVQTEKGDDGVSNTVFRLARTITVSNVVYTATYLTNASLDFSDYTLDIVAEEGSGPRPVIMPNLADGGEAFRVFRARNNLTLRGVYVTNRNATGTFASQIIRCSADDIVVIVEDCMLEHAAQSVFRLDDDGADITLTNSIFANIGVPSDPNNGRVVDDRGSIITSLIATNCTFYNITSRVLRDDGGLNDYIEFNHNTFVNVGLRCITLGETINSKIINNNFIDCGYLGYSNSEDAEFIISLDTLGDDATEAQTATLTNNNFYSTPAVVAALPDTINSNGNFNPLAAGYADDATTTNEAITFTAGIELATPYLAYYTDPDNVTDYPRNTAPMLSTPYAFDFAYATSTASYTGATDGKPLGATSWFDLTSGLKQAKSQDLVAMSCSPNPVVNNASISFQLTSKSLVNIDVISLSGAVMQTVYSGSLSAGKNEVDLSVSNLNSGVYFLRLVNGNSTSIEKFIVQ